MSEIQKYGICTWCNIAHHGVCQNEIDGKKKLEEEKVIVEEE